MSPTDPAHAHARGRAARTALAVAGLACATMSPEPQASHKALLTAAGENYGGRYAHEVTGFLGALAQATQEALEPDASGIVPAVLAAAGGPSLQAGAGAAGGHSADSDEEGPGSNDGYGDFATGSSNDDDYDDDDDSDDDSETSDDGARGGERYDPSSDDGHSEFDDGEAEDPPTLELQAALMKPAEGEAGERMVALENGALLHDGDGDSAAGDRFRIFFRPNVGAWVYVVSVDATGWVQPVFPSAFPDAQNPVEAQSTVLLPEAGYWLGLDSYEGTEHFYFYASLEPHAELEEKLAYFAGLERSLGEDPAHVGVPLVVEQAFVRQRGIPGARPGPATTFAPRVEPSTFSFGLAGADLVVTRYFEHR